MPPLNIEFTLREKAEKREFFFFFFFLTAMLDTKCVGVDTFSKNLTYGG